ncbi:hypothetical protein D3C75_1171340 [compost metagenome]
MIQEHRRMRILPKEGARHGIMLRIDEVNVVIVQLGHSGSFIQNRKVRSPDARFLVNLIGDPPERDKGLVRKGSKPPARK